MGHVEERIAEFAITTNASEVPAESFAAARRSVFDVVGCILAAAPLEHGKAIVRYSSEEGGNPGVSSILGVGATTSRSAAALANGTLAHGLDFDDGRTGCGHAASVYLPTALAVAEPSGASGRDLLTAYAVGLEVVTQVSEACEYEEKDAGFHRTSLFGTMGGVATAARLFELTQEQTVMALGIAGSESGGICQNFGTYTKPLHAGLAARNAVMAARLASDGWTGTSDVFGGLAGWTASFVKHFDYDGMSRNLGTHWRTAERIPLIKRFPCCGLNQGPLESLLSLIEEHGFTAGDVEQMEMGAPYDSMVMMYPRPNRGFEGKFSLVYSMATALIDGRLDVDSYTDEKLARPVYAETVDKIRVNITSKWETKRPEHPVASGKVTGRVKADDGLPVTVRLKDGTVLSRSTPRVTGLTTEGQIHEKFRSNARRTLSDAGVETALRTWWAIDEVADVREAVATVAGPSDRA